MTAPLRDALAKVLDAAHDADDLCLTGADAGELADRVLHLLVEHREQVLAHLGMTVVGWRHPVMGRVHAHEDRCDRQGCVPVYALTSQGCSP